MWTSIPPLIGVEMRPPASVASWRWRLSGGRLRGALQPVPQRGESDWLGPHDGARAIRGSRQLVMATMRDVSRNDLENFLRLSGAGFGADDGLLAVDDLVQFGHAPLVGRV